MGVYVNDLNLHDSSTADFGLNTANLAELQLALDQVKKIPRMPIPSREGERAHYANRADFSSTVRTEQCCILKGV